MNNLPKVGFVIEDFGLGSPAQQLLDRFLLGFPHDGEFQPPTCSVQVHAPLTASESALRRRVEEHALVCATEMGALVAWADALVIIPQALGGDRSDALIQQALRVAKNESRCFIHGTLGSNLPAARRHAQLATDRQIVLANGTATSVCTRIPDIDLPMNAALQEALVVVQGVMPTAELDALEILLPLVARRGGGEKGVRAVSALSNDEVWQAAADRSWSWDLLAAAISRSDSPQGDPVRDGRTQDIVGLGLIPQLARDPKAWLIEHRDGLRSSLLILNGVVKDQNFALRLSQGPILSAQVYRPPPPQRNEFSRLTASIQDFLLRGKRPAPLRRNLLTVGLLDTFRSNLSHPKRRVETPEL